jgi:hypothetical protein
MEKKENKRGCRSMAETCKALGSIPNTEANIKSPYVALGVDLWGHSTCVGPRPPLRIEAGRWSRNAVGAK